MTDTNQQPESASTPAPAQGGESEGRTGTSFWQIAHSVGAGLLGVQSRKNRERDFTQGKPIHFLIGGVIGTVLFLLVVWLLVQYLLATS